MSSQVKTTNFIKQMLDGYQAQPSKTVFIEVAPPETRPTSSATFLQQVGCVQAFLKQHMVERGDRVVLLAPNSVPWAACDLAILALGGICVPLYYRQAIKELAFMINDCQPKVILVWDRDVAHQLTSLVDHPQAIVEINSALKTPYQGVDYVSVRGEDCVTIVYTSGTSGQPKGAMISQSNVDYMLAQTLHQLDATVDRSRPERVFHFLPVCFMGSRIMLWSQMLRQQTLWLSTDFHNLKKELQLADPSYYLNVPAVLERIRHGVTDVIQQKSRWIASLYTKACQGFATKGKGSLWYWLARPLILAPIRRKIGNHLQFLICGSAPLRPDTQTWFTMLGIPVLQVYGLTETTAIITMDVKDRVREGWVGRALPGCDLKLTDEGELICKGPNNFIGYWRRPEETQQTLKGGWLYTGDQAEITPDGFVRILGRMKNILVSEAGHNIVPEAIEEILVAACPGLEHVVIIGHGRPYLTAIVTGQATDQDISRAINTINEDLPHYKRIKKYFYSPEPLSIDKGLLTANMKIKRKAIEQYFIQPIGDLYRDAGRSL